MEIKMREEEREMLTGLDGSSTDTIRIGSSRSKGLECILDQQNNTLPLITESNRSKQKAIGE